jgi:hypothetical protein
MHFIRLPMKLIRLLRSARPEANLLAASATTLLVLKVLVLNRFPAFFSGAYELGLIVERILASIAASYVFYLLVVHLKAQSDKAAVPAIHRKAYHPRGWRLSQSTPGNKQINGRRHLTRECHNRVGY